VVGRWIKSDNCVRGSFLRLADRRRNSGRMKTRKGSDGVTYANGSLLGDLRCGGRWRRASAEAGQRFYDYDLATIQISGTTGS